MFHCRADLYTPAEIPLQNYSAPPAIISPPPAQKLQQQQQYKPQYNPAPTVSPFKPAYQQPQAAPAQFSSPSPSSFYRPPSAAEQQPHFVAPAPYIPKQASTSPFRPAAQQPNNYSNGNVAYQPPHQQQQQQQHQPLKPLPQQSFAPQPLQQQHRPNYGGSAACSPLPPPALRTNLDLNQVENYNRAARGWGQTKDYYRPITFNKPKVAVPYSDF